MGGREGARARGRKGGRARGRVGARARGREGNCGSDACVGLICDVCELMTLSRGGASPSRGGCSVGLDAVLLCQSPRVRALLLVKPVSKTCQYCTSFCTMRASPMASATCLPRATMRGNTDGFSPIFFFEMRPYRQFFSSKSDPIGSHPRTPTPLFLIYQYICRICPSKVNQSSIRMTPHSHTPHGQAVSDRDTFRSSVELRPPLQYLRQRPARARIVET